MQTLLLGGAPNVGKTRSIYRLTNYLIHQKNFSDTMNRFPPNLADFRTVLEGLNKNGNKIRIIVNTASDDKGQINAFRNFYHQNGSYDIMISSVRDIFWQRTYFFNKIGVQPTDPNVLEIPLAKITRRTHWTKSITWFESSMDDLVYHTLNNPPYNI